MKKLRVQTSNDLRKGGDTMKGILRLFLVALMTLTFAGTSLAQATPATPASPAVEKMEKKEEKGKKVKKKGEGKAKTKGKKAEKKGETPAETK